VLRVGAVIAASAWAPGWITETYAVSGAVFYLAYLTLLLKVTGTQWASIHRGLLGGWRALAAWVAAATLLGLAIQGVKAF
jgi:hypothetical protein